MNKSGDDMENMPDTWRDSEIKETVLKLFVFREGYSSRWWLSDDVEDKRKNHQAQSWEEAFLADTGDRVYKGFE